MKKILFVAAVISLLNACSESVYELPNGSAGGTNDGDVHEGAPCNVATDEAFCTSNGYAMQCINNEWDLLECNIGCKGGVCIEKEQIKEESCEGEEIYSWCTADGHSLAFGCKHTHVKESGIIISTMTCAAGCNETTKECYDCDKDIKCCKEDDNTCQKICIDHRCIPKNTLLCMRDPTFVCDQDDSGQTYTLYCNESAIEGFVNVQCEGNKKCSNDRQACVECTNNDDCKHNGKDNHICEDYQCVEPKCAPGQTYDQNAGKCVNIINCTLDGVKAYLQEHPEYKEEYGINSDNLNDDNTCIISYDADQNSTALSCGKLATDNKERDIIFCGTVYLDEFDGQINNIIGRKIFGVHDATITSHGNTTIRNPLFGAVTDSSIFRLKIKNIDFSDIGNNEQGIRGIIEKVESTENTQSKIEGISIENVSIISNFESSSPIGGFIGEAKHLSAKYISVEYLQVSVIYSKSDIGGLFGKASDVTLYNLNIQNTSVNAHKTALMTAGRYENVGGVAGSGNLHVYGGLIYDLTIDTDMNNVGGLIGESNDVTTINPDKDNSYSLIIVSDRINGYENIGGLIGKAKGHIIINSRENESQLRISSESIEGKDNLGGLIGHSDDAALSLHHIKNTINTIIGSNNIGGFIGSMNVNKHIEDNKFDIDIDDVNNNCTKSISSCLFGNSNIAGFVGSMSIKEDASANISNIDNSFSDPSISATFDAAGFVGEISIDTKEPGKLIIDNIVSNVGAIKGTDRVGGFIASISFGDADAEDPQLKISNVTSNAVVFASDEESSENTKLYYIAMTYFSDGKYLANKLKTDITYTQNKGAGFINTISNNWYANAIATNDLTNKYMHDYDYCCNTPSTCIPGHAICREANRYYKWPPNFVTSFYENAFTSKISVSNIAVKHDTQPLNAANRQKHNGYNTLSRYIDKINQRACAGSDEDGLMKSLDQINAFNSIYRKNIFIYSTVDHGLPSSPPGREKELYSVNHTYSYPLNDCDYADFNDNNANNIYIMYDKYCDVGESRECTENNMSEIDALTDMTKENAYHVTEVPNLINSEGLQTWHFDKTLGLPVPALQGIVVKQAEPLPFELIEPIDPDDSREPAPDSPVEP